jgi:membrane associated rhomboid family serine protease
MASLARRGCAAAAACALGASALLFSSTGRTANCALPPPPPPPSPPPPRHHLLSDASGSGFHLQVVAPEGVRTAFYLFCANATIWCAWQVRREGAQRFLAEWFMTRGAAERGQLLSPGALARALLSSYSHSSILHLGANMAGLLSFAPRCMDGRESPAAPKLSQLDFLAMYTAAGVAGGLGSTAFSAHLGTGRPGLGASGSIFAVLTYAVLAYPDSRVLLFFVLEMSAENALLAATALNVYMAGREYMAARGRGAFL